MPRNRMLTQIDDELMLAKAALNFWREQTLLADLPLRACAERACKLQEKHIEQLIDIQEHLADMGKPAEVS
ncbi:MAG TPA: hypothetical protein VL336_06420 [Sphingomicrobium sp.]|jgi:hypothetical protein|nr:hypothetical protein [Sphingomicrobium sp.]